MKLKKIYIEITNICNLDCSFCIKNERKPEMMSLKNFEIILDKIKDYTDYIYLHILGEPLLNKDINDFINLASKKGFFINITTNGYLINKIKNNKNIRQINISLHSFDERYNKSLDSYLDDIFDCSQYLSKNNTYISYRLWVKSKYTNIIIKKLQEKYNIEIKKNLKLEKNIFINFEQEFIWPDLNNDIFIENGTCYALTDHIGILVDGTVIPCCLDTKGIIKLGNIFNNSLNHILNSKKALNMTNGFKNNKKIEELCKHCSFLRRKEDV